MTANGPLRPIDEGATDCALGRAVVCLAGIEASRLAEVHQNGWLSEGSAVTVDDERSG